MINYTHRYENLLETAKHGNYMEHHHIVPKCLGGSDTPENIIMLRPEDHFVAHYLLMKMNPENYELAFAVFAMTGGHTLKSTENRNRIFDLEIYSKAREEAHIMASKYFKSLPIEKQNEIKNKISIGLKRAWENITNEEYDARIKHLQTIYDKLPEDVKLDRNTKISAAKKEFWANASEDEIMMIVEKRRETIMNKPESEREMTLQKMSENCWFKNSPSEEQLDNHRKKIIEGMKKSEKYRKHIEKFKNHVIVLNEENEIMFDGYASIGEIGKMFGFSGVINGMYHNGKIPTRGKHKNWKIIKDKQ
jgi:hypothetical protein